ncbi:MAG: Crp/Fnr family transcriptional regulator [Chloroflexi bacterium]|nr:MAG: Crp/Fnr family transcriptional regulator [Chloroflexota bacterium]
MEFMDSGPSWVSRLVEVLQPLSARADRLAATEPFSGLEWPELQFAAGLLNETMVDRGTRMTVQGRRSPRLWVILEGEALVSADARPLRVATTGDFVGLPSMLAGGPSPETTIALSSIRAFEAGPDQFRRLLARRMIRHRLTAAAKAKSGQPGGGPRP